MSPNRIIKIGSAETQFFNRIGIKPNEFIVVPVIAGPAATQSIAENTTASSVEKLRRSTNEEPQFVFNDRSTQIRGWIGIEKAISSRSEVS